MPKKENCLYRGYGKRILDLVIAIPALILLSPVITLIALVVRLTSRGPVLFQQDRVGQGGRIFRAYKFRTMTHTDSPRADGPEIIGHVPDVTAVGYWLRRFKLDELPQLLNVAKGELSVVGPRPDVPEHLSDYNEVARKRLSVPPGLTGLAQIRGGIHLTWPERWQYDAEYVDNLSFATDTRIILQTLPVVLHGEHKFVKQPDSNTSD